MMRPETAARHLAEFGFTRAFRCDEIVPLDAAFSSMDGELHFEDAGTDDLGRLLSVGIVDESGRLVAVALRGDGK